MDRTGKTKVRDADVGSLRRDWPEQQDCHGDRLLDRRHTRVIFKREFNNSEVKSIEIVKIQHPMLGGIIDVYRLDDIEKNDFLNDFDNLKEKRLYKAGANYVIRIIFTNDTLRLKICNDLVANRNSDNWYSLKKEKSIIQKYIDQEKIK